jgi:hypothetical protein
MSNDGRCWNNLFAAIIYVVFYSAGGDKRENRFIGKFVRESDEGTEVFYFLKYRDHIFTQGVLVLCGPKFFIKPNYCLA